MIECKFYRTREDGVILVQSKSTDGYLLLQKETGVLLPDPIDVGEKYFDEKTFEVKYKPKYFSYKETDEKIQEETENA